MTDLRLLSELNDLQDSRYLEYLKAEREAIVSMVKAVPTDRQCNICIGQLIEIDRRIHEIETAREQMNLTRQQAQLNAHRKVV